MRDAECSTSSRQGAPILEGEITDEDIHLSSPRNGLDGSPSTKLRVLGRKIILGAKVGLHATLTRRRRLEPTGPKWQRPLSLDP